MKLRLKVFVREQHSVPERCVWGKCSPRNADIPASVLCDVLGRSTEAGISVGYSDQTCHIGLPLPVFLLVCSLYFWGGLVISLFVWTASVYYTITLLLFLFVRLSASLFLCLFFSICLFLSPELIYKGVSPLLLPGVLWNSCLGRTGIPCLFFFLIFLKKCPEHCQQILPSLLRFG